MENPNSQTEIQSALQPAMITPVPQQVSAQPVVPPLPTPQKMAASGNPLLRHFRQPALYISLTSNGKFWADGALELTATGEIPVYPMTAKDEIILKTPDALVNGTSVVQVIQSCCPNIKNAWEMPSIDVDSTLIAIRIASFGPTMSVSAKCPHCEEEHDYEINLQHVRDQVQSPNYDETIVTSDGVTIKLRPLTYNQISKAGSVALAEEKLIQSLNNDGIDDAVKAAEFDKHLKKMIEVNVDNATACTGAVIADGNVVTDPAYIKEYYQNVESSVLRKIQSKVKEYSDVVSIKPQPTLCTACEKQFNLNIEFDYSRFFDSGF